MAEDVARVRRGDGRGPEPSEVEVHQLGREEPDDVAELLERLDRFEQGSELLGEELAGRGQGVLPAPPFDPVAVLERPEDSAERWLGDAGLVVEVRAEPGAGLKRLEYLDAVGRAGEKLDIVEGGWAGQGRSPDFCCYESKALISGPSR